MKETSKARVYIVDDEPVVRHGLRLLIQQQADLVVCGEAESSRVAFGQIMAGLPDLVVVDLTLEEGSGFELMRQLRKADPTLKLLVFSMHEEMTFVEAAFKAGADGYITKDEGAEKLLEAIRQLLQGQPYLAAVVAAKLPPDCSWWPVGEHPPRLRVWR